MRTRPKDEFRSPLRPVDPPRPPSPPALAPPWVALLAAWMGLLMLLASVVFTLLPAGHHPRAQLDHREPYSLADRFLPVPIYGVAVSWFIASIVLWQMRKEPRPLSDALVAQRVQAWAGIVLATLGAAVIYINVFFRGPR